MTQQDIKTDVSPNVQKAVQQSAEQATQTALQTSSIPANNSVQAATKPHFPVWPTSKPGPRTTPPMPGMAATHPFRPEQFTEIGYDQVTGEPGNSSLERSVPDEAKTGPVSSDLKPKTGQETLGKRKQRL